MKSEQRPEFTKDEFLERFYETRRPEDFGPVIKAHIKMVYRVIYRIVLNKEEAEDLVQETMMKAYEKIDSFRGQSKFSTWLCQIGVNVALSARRDRKYVLSNNLEAMVEDDTSNNPDQMMMSSEELQRIDQAISGLSAKLRAVITLSVFEQMDIPEMAIVLKCPRATVYWRLHEARKILMEKLEVKDG